MSFGSRLAAAMTSRGPVCFGIDPHPGLLDSWGLTDDADGLAAFADACLEAFGSVGAAIKPQSAFFERHGSRGIAVLERLLTDAADAGVLTILDVKRGDIGSTMAAYAEAYLMDGSPLAADAITVSPYLGAGSLDPAVELARRTGRGLFTLCLTSNPEGPGVQHAQLEGRAVAAGIAEAMAQHNAGASPLGSFGLVLGATIGSAVHDLEIDLLAVNGPLLAPGIGAQGASPSQLHDVFGPARDRVLATTSRGVLWHGRDPVALRDAAERARDEIRAALGA